jgi:hypothetical protein
MTAQHTPKMGAAPEFGLIQRLATAFGVVAVRGSILLVGRLAMSRPDESPAEKRYRTGFTPTGSTRHIIDSDATETPRGVVRERSVCNVVVRDMPTMMSEFDLDEPTIRSKAEMPFCHKCVKWLKTMRYLSSQQSEMAASQEFVDFWSQRLGFDTGELAEVIDFLQWKRARGKA